MSSPPPTGASTIGAPITPLEQEVLDGYHRLLNSMKNLLENVNQLAEQPPQQILESLRELEKKSGLVFTLFKASVYRLMLQEQYEEPEDNGNGGGNSQDY